MNGWPLESLDLELRTTIPRIDGVSTAPLGMSILRLCAPTLQKLNLQSLGSLGGQENYTFLNQKAKSLPLFASLRHLTIGMLSYKDPSILQALVTDSLWTLDINTENNSPSEIFFHTRGTVRNLECFTEDAHELNLDHPLDFLRENPQLLKLVIPHSISSTLLDSKILPLLSLSFFNLKSLSLIWEGVAISESALENISTLLSLEQLHLSSGNQYGWRHDWHINHNTMRRYLSNLRHLQKVAFSRDTYYIKYFSGPLPPHPIPTQTYYSSQILPIEEQTDNPKRDQISWKRKHRSMMLNRRKPG